MVVPITVSDPDRKIDVSLAVDYTFLPGIRPRAGWRDGGSCGEPPAVQLERARCLELLVWCGPFAVAARPVDRHSRTLADRLGRWCLDEYSAEIEAAVWKRIRAYPRSSA